MLCSIRVNSGGSKQCFAYQPLGFSRLVNTFEHMVRAWGFETDHDNNHDDSGK